MYNIDSKCYDMLKVALDYIEDNTSSEEKIKMKSLIDSATEFYNTGEWMLSYEDIVYIFNHIKIKLPDLPEKLKAFFIEYYKLIQSHGSINILSEQTHAEIREFFKPRE